MTGIRFNRREFSGAFGDLGNDLPLLAGMIVAVGLDSGWVFCMFGVMQMASALAYRIPMPVQPLKAVAALVIAQGIGLPVIQGAALAVALIMALLTVTGFLGRLARLIPRPVITGIQVGLGLKLGWLAARHYVPAEGAAGWFLAMGCVLVLAVLSRQRRFPAAVAVLAIGVVYALARGADPGGGGGMGFAAPSLGLPGWSDFWAGLILLALPQIPLSLGNSVLATHQLAQDWFPGSRVTLTRIGGTYAALNAAAAVLGAIPVCHGSGGMAGHYAMGGRTGGSVVIYGGFFLLLAAVVGLGFTEVIVLFPLPVLGVILMVESAVLVGRIQAIPVRSFGLVIVVAVAITANTAPYGFFSAMVLGCLLAGLRRQWPIRQFARSR